MSTSWSEPSTTARFRRVALGQGVFLCQSSGVGRGHGRWAVAWFALLPANVLEDDRALCRLYLCQDDRGLYVNLFVGSQATIRRGGKDLKIRQVTRYRGMATFVCDVTPEEERPTTCTSGFPLVANRRALPTRSMPRQRSPGRGLLVVRSMARL